MKLIKKDEIRKEHLPGRVIQKTVGKDAVSESGKMTMGFAHYSDESGLMEPHHHAEDIVYILSAEDGWVRKGPAPEALGDPILLEPGITLHFPALEWHVFEFNPGGHVEIIFFYGQVDNIRLEEKKDK